LKQHLYAPPRQRQKWGETQVLPRINWRDLFFDLHYVAATYNISNILVSDVTPLGYLYAAGTFFPILQIWMEHAVFSSKFVYDNDIAHCVLHILALLVVATAVLNIRPVDIMSHSSTEISMFVFCLCLGLERCLTLLRYVELHFFGVGQTKVLQKDAMAAMCRALFLLVFYIAAMTVAAMKFFPRQHADKEYNRLLADATAGAEKDEYQAAAADEESATHIPIILCLVGVLLHAVGHVIFVIFFFPTSVSHKKL
jgi:low temperature requirement protein LtrA